jgi:hypothetical protein
MLTPEIEEFARILVHRVRDATIQRCDRTVRRPNPRSPIVTRWKEAALQSTPEAFAEVLIPDIVDDTVFYLLNAIDQELLHLKFVSSGGKEIDLVHDSLGELGGWYRGSEGWRAMNSKARFVNDCADLDTDCAGEPAILRDTG